MLTQNIRSRAVSSTSTIIPLDNEVAQLVNDLTKVDLSTWQGFRDDLVQSGILQQLRHNLKDEDTAITSRDVFRKAGGLQVILESIGNLVEVCDQSVVDTEAREVVQNLAQLLLVLEAALVHHAGSSRYFRTRIHGNGWVVLRGHVQTLASILFGRRTDLPLLELFYGVLFAASAGDEGLSAIYSRSSRAYPGPERSWDLRMAERLEEYVAAQLESTTSLALPDMLPILVSTWSLYLQKSNRSVQTINLTIPISIRALLVVSQQRVVEAHTAGLLSSVVPLLFEGQHSLVEKSSFRRLALLMLRQGVTGLDDAYTIFSKAASSAAAASFLLEAIKTTKNPPSIQFDLSKYGSCSIELASLRKNFPPPDTDGYSISLWAKFDAFDESAHTTLFGACDKTQTCFVLAYLERDSKHLILQTATKGSRPSVRFKTFRFETGSWYHICIVHRRPRGISSSKASLFVNGCLQEQVKANYPSVAPSERGSSTARVQAFFGTPQDLAPNSGGARSAIWSLASAMLLAICASQDLIAIVYHLGPVYSGNLQDTLGSFQTYANSAALSLRQESSNVNESLSNINIATHELGSNMLPEDAILLNISPEAVLDNDDRNNVDESQLIKSLSRTAAKNLTSYTRAGANAIVVNGAVPSINDALTQTNGVAILMGEPIVVVPQSLDDVSWRLGGCAALGLAMISKAKTTEDVATTVEILLELTVDSWRNSEVMERNNSYSILDSLIKDKLGSNISTDPSSSIPALPTPNLDRTGLAFHLLKVLLVFCGYNFGEPSKSMITNPLAYKILLLDSTIWRTAHFDVQELYFAQLTVFAKDSIYAKFNLKRFAKMRAFRRLLDALKAERVLRSSVPVYFSALSAILPSSMSAETLRSMALFITYCVHKRNTSERQRKPVRSRASSGTSTLSLAKSDDIYLSQQEIGVEVLKLYANMLCNKADDTMIKKFAKTVTNKWLLYLLTESSAEVVVYTMRILARLLVVLGGSYAKKFKERTGGFVIMTQKLRRWWHLPALWPICFAILFDLDIAELDLERNFDLFSFIDIFNSNKQHEIVCSDMFQVMADMLEAGLKAVISPRKQDEQETDSIGLTPPRLSMSSMTPYTPAPVVTAQNREILHTIIRFLSDLQARSGKFRDYAASSTYIEGLFTVLFAVVVGVDIIDASTELNAGDLTLSFKGSEVVVRPLSSNPSTIRLAEQKPDKPMRGKLLRRGSSFVLLSRDRAVSGSMGDSAGKSATADASVVQPHQSQSQHTVVQSILELVVTLFVDQIMTRKDFPGLGLFLKTPPGFVEHRTFFESWILRNTISQLTTSIALNQIVLTDAKVLTNLARFIGHLGDAIFEGWFVGGEQPSIDLACTILEYLQRGEVSVLKSVRLCAQSIATIRISVLRIELLTLSNLEQEEHLVWLTRLAYWQTVIVAVEEAHATYLQLLCYLLYGSLISGESSVRTLATDLWRMILIQRPADTAAILAQADTVEQQKLTADFQNLVELDNKTFLEWVDEHRSELDHLFFNTLSKAWDTYVLEENEKTNSTAKSRVTRRQERLRILAREQNARDELLRRHDITFEHWTANISTSEHLKHQRSMQDQQDDLNFISTVFEKMKQELSLSTGLLGDDSPRQWRVDQTEGRNRMRMRLIKDRGYDAGTPRPKRKASSLPTLRVEINGLKSLTHETVAATPGGMDTASSSEPVPGTEPFPCIEQNDTGEVVNGDEAFEIIEDPNTGEDEFEDKNRKVMRMLERGDQVKHVFNISRVAGLEAIEGLLILGKTHVYLVDNFFQKADGEIVYVWQASSDERDPYVGMIAGRDLSQQKVTAKRGDHEKRSWKWSEVISMSKRRFLFRDVSIELFFGDGRSYLLTIATPKARNELYSLLTGFAPQYDEMLASNSEHLWRYEALRSFDDEPQRLGSRFTSIFSQPTTLAATKKWQKGEMSNFHYLMLVNTLAGRTYNDLTQYPVFPWVIADYTSQELDLQNPHSYRDLSKPMGCQNPAREAEFRDRYKQFAEMGDANAPPFHYGTHYSSAMIVTSYLIRLEPFVRSYLLLQGGSFDHPDRMFYSIEGAWRSASRTNMTDVRELTPEFFYLPEFLTNPNGYDFGQRQNSTQSISNVVLPPWAKNDPKIFIAKNRDALESPYVSKHLHKWIDLIFGAKSKGEAAVEAVNVFHHLSYQGAKNLDAITDSVERLATIGIIHNFGQTPHQIFQRLHPARENAKHKYKRLDIAAESLTRLPGSLLESEERVASMTYAPRADKLLCSGAFRLNMPPTFDKYMEWGFCDNSIRFYATDTRKQIGLYEHLHIGQLSCAMFAGSKTLVTAGVDCTVAVWSILTTGKAVDVQLRKTLFGHRASITQLAYSQCFNALLSCSSSGELILWSLNRCEFVRRIAVLGNQQIGCATINDVTGNVIVCHGCMITIFTLNGEFLLSQDTAERPDDTILSVACYEGAANEWLERNLIFTGHRHGIVKVWSLVVSRLGEFELDLIRHLNHVDGKKEDGGNVSAGISSILAMPQVVYTGDEDGRVVEWNCVQRH